MSYEFEAQTFNPIPPRRANGFALTVDGTVRVYDTKDLPFGGTATWDEAGTGKALYLTLHADGGDMYFRFHSDNTNDMVTATVIAAGGTLSLQNAFAQKLPSGAFADIRFDRVLDRFLSITGTGTLRLHASSQPPK